MLSTLAIANYRSIREHVLPVGRLNLVSGANGVGKSNLYRALRLLSEAGDGTLARAIAREGGLESVLWAGPESGSNAMKRGEQPVQGGLAGLELRCGSDLPGTTWATPSTSGFRCRPGACFCMIPRSSAR